MEYRYQYPLWVVRFALAARRALVLVVMGLPFFDKVGVKSYHRHTTAQRILIYMD